MGIDLSQIKNKLNKLQNTTRKNAEQWKPTPGKHQVRIVPYKYNKDNPFIELYFHYNVKGKTYLSPISFGRPDPIAEFADKLKRMGDRDDWKAGKKMEPKLRTYVPVIVRGEESQGVRFWGFGKTVYQDILGYIADPDYGDITDPKTGRDITVEYQSAEDAGSNYPVTTIRVKPNQTPMMEDLDEAKKLIKDQVEITDLYSELSYDELAQVLDNWINPDGDDTVAPDNTSSSGNDLSNDESKKSTAASFDGDDNGLDRLDELSDNSDSNDKSKKSVKVDDVASQFDDLFDED